MAAKGIDGFPMILIIDNFACDGGCTAGEMARALATRRQEVVVHGNDSVGLDEVEAIAPDLIILSPGVCTPREAGISVSAVQRFAGRIPILGIGAGFHCVAAAFGAAVVRAEHMMWMKEGRVDHDSHGVFDGLPTPITVVRSHSLIVKADTLPTALRVTATSSHGEIMGIRHCEHAIEGVQFRPVVDAKTPRISAPAFGHVYTFDDLLWGVKRFSTPRGNRIEIVSVTDEILQFLRSDDDNIFKIRPREFELLICDRLHAAGFDVSKVGRTFAHDGGIDLIACPRYPVLFPYLLAVQVKHHHRPGIKTGVPDVRQFDGAIGHCQVQAGALVTNTAFTPDAVWWARSASKLLMLRDLRDVRRWLCSNFVDLAERRDLPSEIVLGKDIVVPVPRFSRIPDVEWDGSSGS